MMGALSDRIGRLPLLIGFSLIALLTAIPSMLGWSPTRLSGGCSVALLVLRSIFGSYNGAMVVFLTEIMPAHVRTSGFSLAYSLATGLFGGFTPAIPLI